MKTAHLLALSIWALMLLTTVLSSTLVAQRNTNRLTVCDPLPDTPQQILAFLTTTRIAVDGRGPLDVRLERVFQLDTATIANMVQKRLPYEEDYTPKNAGSLAVASYRLFHDLGSAGRYDSAAMFYHLAWWLKERWIACDVEHLRDFYRSASQAVRDHRLDDADSTIFAFYQTDHSRPGWPVAADSLQNLFVRLRAQIEGGREAERTERAAVEVTRSWRAAVVVGGWGVAKRSRPDLRFQYNPQYVGSSYAGYDFASPALPATAQPAFGFTIDHFIHPRMTVGVRFQAGKSTVAQELTVAASIPYTTSSYSESYWSAGARFQYYLERGIGLCPFLSGGLDYFGVKRDPITFPNDPAYGIPKMLSLGGRSSSVFGGAVDFGADYEFSATSQFYLSASAGARILAFPNESNLTVAAAIEIRGGFVIL